MNEIKTAHYILQEDDSILSLFDIDGNLICYPPADYHDLQLQLLVYVWERRGTLERVNRRELLAVEREKWLRGICKYLGVDVN